MLTSEALGQGGAAESETSRTWPTGWPAYYIPPTHLTSSSSQSTSGQSYMADRLACMSKSLPSSISPRHPPSRRQASRTWPTGWPACRASRQTPGPAPTEWRPRAAAAGRDGAPVTVRARYTLRSTRRHGRSDDEGNVYGQRKRLGLYYDKPDDYVPLGGSPSNKAAYKFRFRSIRARPR